MLRLRQLQGARATAPRPPRPLASCGLCQPAITSRPHTCALLHLLPALPGAWPDGDVAGLRARGGLEVALSWRAGRLVTATIAFTRAAITSLRYGDIETTVEAGAGAILDLSLAADGTSLTQSWR